MSNPSVTKPLADAITRAQRAAGDLESELRNLRGAMRLECGQRLLDADAEVSPCHLLRGHDGECEGATKWAGRTVRWMDSWSRPHAELAFKQEFYRRNQFKQRKLRLAEAHARREDNV